MSDDFNAASAAPETAPSTPADTGNAAPDNSLDSSLDRAFLTAFGEGEEGGNAEAGQPRDASGRFAAREQQEGQQQPGQAEKPVQAEQPAAQPGKTDVPTRFSADAKAAWATVPDPVKYEINRTISEMETGLRQYQEQWEPLKNFDAEAKQHGTTIPTVLTRFSEISKGLQSDNFNERVHYIDRLCRHAGTTLQTLAAVVMGQKPDEVQASHTAEVNGLRQEIAALKQQIGGVSTSMRSQELHAIEAAISDFASQPGHERFEELSADIKFFFDSGRAADLEEAYQLAAKLNPAAPIQTTPTNAAQTRGDPAHTRARKGGMSVTGAPGSGSDPRNRMPPATIDDAIDRSFAAVGL